MADKVDSLIFDLDGTLWDASPAVAKSWEEVRPQLDYEIREITADDVRSVAGMQHEQVYEKLFPELSKEQREELIKLSSSAEMKYIEKYGGELYNDVKATLAYLKNKYKLFIVSNCQDGYIEAFLDYHKLHTYFHDHECSGRTGNPKWDNLKAIVKRNNLQAPVYVGDTEGDHEASVKANIPFVFAAYGFREVVEYDYCVRKFRNLRDIF